ncbi:MAG TPA: Holliday junction resolvase RuvX [Phototrophicaceae bacterium]|nr:Holliday junction resolvase RuvX [Phototrophicaceae bacterium]
MSRWIGVDHGLARIGVAVSDQVNLTARELTIIERQSKREDFARLNALAAEQKATAFIVGLPSDFDTPETVVYTQADKVRAWVEHFKATTPLPIILWDEQLTTVEAHELAQRLKRPARARVDDLAARVMLQSYLDAVRDGLAEPPSSAGQA